MVISDVIDLSEDYCAKKKFLYHPMRVEYAIAILLIAFFIDKNY